MSKHDLDGIKYGPVLQRTLGESSMTLPGGSIIVLIERLDGKNLGVYGPKAFELYVHSFPSADEREPVDDIKERIIRYSTNGADADGGEFHAHVFLDKQGRILGYSQGSIMPCGKAGLAYFWQYGAVADELFLKTAYGVTDFSARKLGVSKLMHTIHDKTLASCATRLKTTPLGELWESEQKGLGETATDIQFTHQRLVIHTKSGGRVMLGREKASARLINLHLQPRLTKDTEPIALHLMLRSMGSSSVKKPTAMTVELARNIIVAGFLDNFIREGFDISDVDEAKAEINSRLDGCDEVHLLPASDVPDVVTLAEGDALLTKQLLALYKVDTLQLAREKHDKAMSTKS